MTAKDKAKELVDKYDFLKQIFIPSIYEQKQCALIAVEETLNAFYSLRFGNALDDELEYWEEVKIEIQKI